MYFIKVAITFSKNIMLFKSAESKKLSFSILPLWEELGQILGPGTSVRSPRSPSSSQNNTGFLTPLGFFDRYRHIARAT